MRFRPALPSAFCLLLFACNLQPPASSQGFFSVSVWYGGGKVRAPMVSRDPARERAEWKKDLAQIRALGFNTVRMWADWTSEVSGEVTLEARGALVLEIR